MTDRRCICGKPDCVHLPPGQSNADICDECDCMRAVHEPGGCTGTWCDCRGFKGRGKIYGCFQ